MIKLRTQQESSTHKIKSPSCFAILQEFVEKLCKGQQSVWSNLSAACCHAVGSAGILQ